MRGRARAYELAVIVPTIREFVVAQNKKGEPTTAQQISNEIERQYDVVLQVDMMTRVFHELDFHHLQGEMRHIYTESAGDVAFRCTYLAKKVTNRVYTPGPNGTTVLGVSRAEVFLDESFCTQPRHRQDVADRRQD